MPSTTGTLTKSTDNAKLAKVAAEVATATAGVSQKEKSQEKETSSVQQQSTGAGVKTPPEQPEFIKQALIIIEKKVRNLEKRRQKLDEYKLKERNNEKLNEDQQSAVNKYDEVIRSLELSRELEKQFISLANDAMKQQKKQAKKEQTEREEAIKDKIKETQKYLAALDVFGQESVRNDFLNEQNGAVKISQVELDVLDEFNKLARPTELGAKLETAAAEAADHLVALVDAKNKPIVNLAVSSSFTYAELRRLFDRILSAAYWTNQQQQQLQQESGDPAASEQQISESIQHHAAVDAGALEQQLELNKLSLHHDEQLQQLQQHVALEQAAVYHQQNTSDDYVLVTSTDLSDKDAKPPQSPGQLAQQQANKTFFTTLNPADLQRNINEFISDDGINFLQDSEIQQLHHQQHQQAYQQHVAVQQVEQQQPQTDAASLQYQNQLIAAQQPQQMHPNMQTQSNYGAQPGQQQQQYVQMNQDFGGDQSKEQGYRGPRGQGGPRNYPPRNQQRYDGERRGPRNGGAPPAQQGGQGPRNPAFNGGQRQGQGINGNGPQGQGGYRQNNYAQNRQGGGGGGNGAYRGGDRPPRGQGQNQAPRQGGYQQQPQAV